MATVIAVSSFVARGTVGLRAVVPALERLGHEVMACPTVLLSNHLGHGTAEGQPVAPSMLTALFAGLEANGWLGSADAVLTGYFPHRDHVIAAAAMIDRVRRLRPGVMVVCDPVLGDEAEGLYVPQPVAEAVSAHLIPRATHIKPNRFELSYLAGLPVDALEDVAEAARALDVQVVLASSVPAPGNRLANVVVTRESAEVCFVPAEPHVPHGTGDLLTALFLARLLEGRSPGKSAGYAAAGVAAAIALSNGSDELALHASPAWLKASPLALREMPSRMG